MKIAAAPLSVSNLSVSYDGWPVLRSVSFEASAGELIGIVGPNGAGKSTLLKAVLGLIASDQGEVRVFDQPVGRSRRRLAYVPQTEAVDWDFPVTVRDVVMMGRYGHLGWLGRPGHEDRRLADEALALVDMTAFSRRHIRRLSGGQQQRVFLARALCQQADVLLLDEPFAGVDAATEAAIFRLIESLTSAGRTILIVNHDLSVLNRFHRVMLLNQRIMALGPPQEAASEENLRRTYGGRLSILERAEAALQGAQRQDEPDVIGTDRR